MDAAEIIGHLRQVPLFSRLSEAQMGRVASTVQVETFPRGSRLAVVGRPGRAFYYVLSGEALVSAAHARGRLRPVGYLRPGSYFGVTSILLGEPHDTTIEAKTDLTALVIYRVDLDRLRREAPELDEDLQFPDEITAKMRHEAFAWQNPDEVVVYFAQRHWIILARLLFLPTLALVALGTFLLAALRPLAGAWQAAPLALLLVGYALAVAWYWADWRNDYFVITTQRVAHRELNLLRYESRVEAPLSQVQDVTVKRGRLGNILGFGDAVIQTAAKVGLGAIVFDHVRDPEVAKETIFRQLYRIQAHSKLAEHESARAELKRRLQWATPEDLAAQAQARKAPEAAGPGQLVRRPRAPWPKIRLIPPIREQSDGSVTWRKHWYFLLRRILHWFLASLILIVLFVAYLLGRLPLVPPGNVGVVLGTLVVAAIISFNLWWQATDWGNDVYIVTEDRLIDVEKRPLFGPEDRREATLDRVQNVNLSIPGPLAALLNFGDVDIETAGGEGKFTFTHVMAPHDVQREIMARVNRNRERRQQLESQQRRREIADWFAVYEGLREEHDRPAPAEPAGPGPTPPQP